MTKNEMQEKIEALQENEKILNENIVYYENLRNLVVNRIQENIQYIDENLKNEKNESKKKLLLGLKAEFLSIKSLALDETIF